VVPQRAGLRIFEAAPVRTAPAPQRPDTRHRNSRSIEEQDFGEWTMGYPRVSAKELADIPGLNDFFACGEPI